MARSRPGPHCCPSRVWAPVGRRRGPSRCWLMEAVRAADTLSLSLSLSLSPLPSPPLLPSPISSHVEPDFRLNIYLRISALLLEDGDSVQAEIYVTRASELAIQTTNMELSLKFKVGYNGNKAGDHKRARG